MQSDSDAIAPNANRLLLAGFMAILAAGVGYSVRGGILGQWAEQFGFTMTELGAITGGGLTGFGLVIIFSSLVADKIGYGRLMILAFVLHLISALLTLATPMAFAASGKSAAFMCLFWGMFIFAVGNGLCEAVVNPMTATLFPKNKTHYLNILHAGWPAGLVLGGLASFFMASVVGQLSLLQAMALSGGTTEYSKLNDVVIFRTVGGQRLAALYDLKAIRHGQYPDPEVFAHDVVVVGDNTARRLFKDLLQIVPLLTGPLIIAIR